MTFIAIHSIFRNCILLNLYFLTTTKIYDIILPVFSDMRNGELNRVKDFIETDDLFFSRYIFDELTIKNITGISNSASFKSSPDALSRLIKKNRSRQAGILGWWSDISSAYSAKHHIAVDNKMWYKKEQLQYYIYEKDKPECIGMICALCKDKKATILFWLTEAGSGKHYGAQIQKAIDKELFVTMGMKEVCRTCIRRNPNFSKVESMLTHAGYEVSGENDGLIRWNKTSETYFNENPHLAPKKHAKTQPLPLWARINIALRTISHTS